METFLARVQHSAWHIMKCSFNGSCGCCWLDSKQCTCWWGRHICSCCSLLDALSVWPFLWHCSRCQVVAYLSPPRLSCWSTSSLELCWTKAGHGMGQAQRTGLPWYILVLSEPARTPFGSPTLAWGWGRPLCWRNRFQSCCGEGAVCLLHIKRLKSGRLGSSPSSASFEPGNLISLSPNSSSERQG